MGSVLSGPGGLTKLGDGTLTLAAPDTYGGATTVVAGTLLVGGERPAPAPLATYTLDGPAGQSIADGTTIFDASGNGLNGTMVAGGTSYVAGEMGQAINFTGDSGFSGQCVQIPDSPAFDNLNTWTASAWINLAQQPVGTDGILSTDCNYGGLGSANFEMVYCNTGNGYEIHADIGSQDGTAGGWLTNNADYATTLSLNTWHMITYTVQPGAYAIYLDGQQVATGTLRTDVGDPVFLNTANDVAIGLNNVGYGYMKGAIDDVNIYGTVLTDAEVAALYQFQPGSLPGGTNVQLAAGATLDLNGHSQTIGLSDFGGSGGGTVLSSGAPATLTLVTPTGSTNSFSGTIEDGTGGISLVVTGAGTQVLSGANSYSGGTLLAGGVLDFADGSLPFSTTTPDITFAGGTLQWAAGNSEDVSAGIAPLPTGQIAILDTNGNDVTLAGVLSGPGGLTKLGEGTLTLTAANTFRGVTTIDGGVLAVGTASGTDSLALQYSILNYDNCGGSLDVGAMTSVTLGGLEGGQDLVLENDNGDALALFVGGHYDDTVQTVLRSTTYSGVLSGSGSLTKIGPQVMTLAGVNTYTGGTVIAGGVLQLGADGVLPTNLPLQIGDPNLSSGTLDLNGHNLTLSGLFTGAEGTGHSTFWDEVTNSSSTPATLTVNNASDYDYEGFFSGNLGLAKCGSGTLTVGGTCINTGDAAVYDGMLNVTGGFVGDPHAVPGSGNPQLTGNVDPAYWVVTPGAVQGSAGFQLGAQTFNNVSWLTTAVEATDWQAAVFAAMSGEVDVHSNTGEGNWSITPTSGGFRVGTVAELASYVNALHPGQGDVFQLDQTLNADTTLLVLEDRTNSGHWNDYDYNDDYWVLTVALYRPVTKTPQAGTQMPISAPNVNSSTGAANVSRTDLTGAGATSGCGGTCCCCCCGGTTPTFTYDSSMSSWNTPYGNGWFNTSVPTLYSVPSSAGDPLVVSFGPTNSIWFNDNGNGTFTPMVGAKERSPRTLNADVHHDRNGWHGLPVLRHRS